MCRKAPNLGNLSGERIAAKENLEFTINYDINFRMGRTGDMELTIPTGLSPKDDATALWSIQLQLLRSAGASHPERNELIASLATRARIAHAAPGNKTETFGRLLVEIESLL